MIAALQPGKTDRPASSGVRCKVAGNSRISCTAATPGRRAKIIHNELRGLAEVFVMSYRCVSVEVPLNLK
jgi:hypothetical protein